jgi:hypothetical protein
MRFFFVFLLLSGLLFGGYTYYKQSTGNPISTSSQPETSRTLMLSQSSDKISELAAVLGASIGSTYENGKELLSNATNGASEPIINELVTKTTETLKDLPRREAEKIKYEFCKGVITEYEGAKGVAP